MTTHPALLAQLAHCRQDELRSVGDLRRTRLSTTRTRTTPRRSAVSVPSLRHILAPFRPHPQPATHHH